MKRILYSVALMGQTHYLFRDKFSDTKAAGALDGTASIPGQGLRDVNDVESKIFTTGGRLRGGGQATAVWGDSKVVWTQTDASGFARQAGRALAALILPEEMAVTADIAFGWASAVDIVDPQVDGLGLLMQEVGEMHAITPALKVKLFGDSQYNIRAMQYLVVVALNDVGGAVLLSTFGTDTGNARTGWSIPKYPLARILWVDYADTTTPLFPSVQYLGRVAGGYPNGNSLEDLRIIDVPAWATADALATFADRFTRADSNTTLGANWTADADVWGISSNKAYAVSGTGFGRTFANAPSDGIFRWDITVPASWNGSNAGFGGIMRRTDADNFLRVWNGLLDNIQIQVWQGGAFHATIFVTGYTWTAGQTYKLVVIADGNKYKVFINDVSVVGGGFVEDAGNHQLTGTGIGLYVDNTKAVSRETRWDNVAAYPTQITLPPIFSKGKIPTILTGGTVLGQDAFTGVNGTLLSAHSPDVGPAWVQDNTDWTIQGNAAKPVVPTALQNHTDVVQDLGVTDAECQVEITTPGDEGAVEYFGGIAFRYVDVDNFMFARIVRSDSLQPGSHEVELGYCIAGASGVRHKVNLGNFYVANTTYTLKVQCKGDLVQVFLGGGPVISYYTIATDPAGTKFGLHDYYLETGCTFDNWVVKAL